MCVLRGRFGLFDREDDFTSNRRYTNAIGQTAINSRVYLFGSKRKTERKFSLGTKGSPQGRPGVRALAEEALWSAIYPVVGRNVLPDRIGPRHDRCGKE
jgi:hypothetical protein